LAGQEQEEVGADRPDLIETLVDEEIRRLVADAIRDGECLSASSAAAQILKAYPGCALDESHLVDGIAMAAAKAGVAVEFGKRRAA
jgi:hypothetical protein